MDSCGPSRLARNSQTAGLTAQPNVASAHPDIPGSETEYRPPKPMMELGVLAFYCAVGRFEVRVARDGVHRGADEGDEAGNHVGPVHEIGQGNHGFTPIDALEAFVVQARWKRGSRAMGLEICVLVQEVLANPVCDRVLNFGRCLLRRFDIYGCEPGTGVAELLAIRGEGTWFEHGAPGFRRSGHGAIIRTIHHYYRISLT